jgi:hypothetical protein
MYIFTPNTLIESAKVNANFAELTTIQNAWTAYTPTITADGGSPTNGNSTLDCAYIQIGKTVHGRFSLALGSTGNFGTGTVYWSLPVTARDITKDNQTIGQAYIEDLSTVSYYSWIQRTSSSYMYFVCHTTAGTGRGATVSGSTPVPFGWGVGDYITGSYTYEAA